MDVDPDQGPSRRWARVRRAFEDPVGRIFNGVVAALALVTLIAFSPPGGYFALILLGIWAWFLVGLVWLGRLIGVVAVGRRRSSRGWWTTWLVAPALVAVSAVAIQLDVPLQLRFRLSEPAMTRFATRALEERPRRAPDRIGLYKVGMFETFDGGVRFTVAGAGFIDGDGFAYSPGGRPPDEGDNSYDELRGPWYLWHWHF